MKKKKQTFKILDKVIYCFYNAKKDETRRNQTYFASSGCAKIFTPNDFKIGKVTTKEITSLAEYLLGEKRIVKSIRYRYGISLNKVVSQNVWDDYNLHKYSTKLHKKLCKQFKTKYKKPTL